MNRHFQRAVRDNCPYPKSGFAKVGTVILNRPSHRLGLSLVIFLFAGCQTTPEKSPPPLAADSPSAATPVPIPTDDLILVDGQAFHIGTRVVTWKEKGGYNAYKFQPTKLAGKANHGARRIPSTETPNNWVDREEPWDIPALQNYVDQFVLHYDSEGFSRRCFQVLQRRGLSAHFLLDLDGTIYQTLDLRERAYHAGSSNSRSIGIEIANVGAYGPEEKNEWDDWISADENGNPTVKIPQIHGDPKLRTKGFVARPLRNEMAEGVINGRVLRQYDFTAEQYTALIKLTASLHRIFPLIKLDQPRDPQGEPIHEKLPDEALENYQGLIGHYHLQEIKIDPGPAFQWDKVIEGALRELSEKSVTQ